MKLRIYTLVFLVMLGNLAIAQETIYFSKDTSALQSKKKRHSSENNIIKIAPLGFLYGSIPVFYERSITDFLSVQAGVGITTHNYLREWANNLEFGKPEVSKTVWNGTSEEYESYNSINDFENRKSSLGYSFSIQPRIYFESEGPDGSFLGISYDRARYNFSSKKIVTGPANGDVHFSDETFEEYENISDIAANFGTQTVYDRIAVEYTIGMAIRTVTGKRYAYTMDNSGNYIDGYSEIKKNSPAFLFSIKVGYHF